MGEPTDGVSQALAFPTDLVRAKKIFESVLRSIFHQIESIDSGSVDAAKQTLTKLGDLHRAYLGVKEAERGFNDKHGILAEGEIDFDRLRADIARKLDRLRDSRNAGGFPEEPE